MKKLQKTKMMVEAKAFGKLHSPFIETLILLAIFYASNFAQSFFLMPLMQMHLYSDEEMLKLFSNPQELPDFKVLSERLYSMLLTMPEWLVIANLFLSVCTVIAVIIYCKAIEKRPLSSIGIRKSGSVGDYLMAFAFGVVMMVAAVIMPVIANTVIFEKTFNITAPILTLYLIGYMIQGFAEELLIRGYFLSALSKTTTPTYALICSTFFFTVLHSSYAGSSVLCFINVFMFGLICGLLVIKRGNIWSAAALHAAWNFVQVIVFGASAEGISKTSSVFNVVSLDGFDKLNGGAFGLEGGLWVTLVLFLALGAVISLKQNKKEIAVEENNEKQTEQN